MPRNDRISRRQIRAVKITANSARVLDTILCDRATFYGTGSMLVRFRVLSTQKSRKPEAGNTTCDWIPSPAVGCRRSCTLAYDPATDWLKDGRAYEPLVCNSVHERG